MSCSIFSANLSEADIINRLNLYEHDKISCDILAAGNNPFPSEPPLQAAVLIPLVQMPVEFGGPGWHILYTRRTDIVQHHKGQVSFPGGRSDPGDISPEATALREAFGEIGLHPSHVRILGQMDKFITITNYLVTPVVGIIPWPYTFIPEPNEVSRVFTIPIDWIADSTHYEIRPRELQSDVPVLPQFRYAIYFKPYNGEVLWGSTAEVTLRLIDRLETPLQLAK
jgi:8-oxo-dGTP pyrophosphatase MutT (NUDIX family)